MLLLNLGWLASIPVMNSAQHVIHRGDLATTPVSEVLRQLEVQGVTGQMRLESEIGRGVIKFHAGTIVGAKIAGLAGRPALFRLISLTEGNYTFEYERVEGGAALTQSVTHLLADQEGRMAEWQRLSEQAPPLSSIPRLSEAGREALERQTLSEHEQALLTLVDGRRTFNEVIDASGLDPVDALGQLLFCLQSGLLVERSPQASLYPLSGGAAPAAAERPQVPRPTHAQPLRRTTVFGLGPMPSLEPMQPKAAVRQIISVGGSAVDSGPVEPSAGAQATGTGAAPAGAVTAVVATVAVPPPAPAPAAATEQAPPPSDLLREPEAPRKDDARYVGRYEVLFRIGFGGMGSVYLCRLNSESGFRRLFALKLLRSQLARDSLAAQRFTEEARLAGLIHHPNVVSVVDAGFHGSQPYLVMEYIEGASLKRLISAHETERPPELILPIVIDALAGLHAAHTLVGDDGVPLDIVHCDVSPENLIVGIDGICRLADFGIARHASTVQERHVTRGKPGYLAPEQVLGQKIDARADIFAMGVVLYNFLTGTKLFEAPTAEETLQRVCTQRILPPSMVGLRPSPVFDAVVMKALERDPARRFASAEDMMIELRRIALRENLLSPPTAVANWVRETVGTELAQRRLAVLDASRKAPVRASVPPQPPVAAPIPSPPPPAPDELALKPEHQHALSQTIILPPRSNLKRWLLIGASTIAALLVLVTLLFPDEVSKMFRLNIEGSEALDPTGTLQPGLPGVVQDPTLSPLSTASSSASSLPAASSPAASAASPASSSAPPVPASSAPAP